jgi:hypothetical protein
MGINLQSTTVLPMDASLHLLALGQTNVRERSVSVQCHRDRTRGSSTRLASRRCVPRSYRHSPIGELSYSLQQRPFAAVASVAGGGRLGSKNSKPQYRRGPEPDVLLELLFLYGIT